MTVFRRLIATVAVFSAQGALSASALAQESASAPIPADPSVPAAPAATAAGPSEENLKVAGERYQRGLASYAEGEYVLALVEFERAYQLAPNYRVLYNIGQVRIQLGRYAKAREALEEYLKQGGEEVAADRKKGVQTDLEMLGERTATLNVYVNEDGADISVDGAVVGTSPLSVPLVVDAGEHTVRVHKQGFYDKSSQVTLAGRDEVEVRAELSKLPEAPQSVVVERPQVRQKDSAIWIGWATTGALAAGAGVAGYLGVTKANDLESMRTDYGVSRKKLDDTKSSARSLFIVADIVGGAAVIAGGISLYLTLSGSSSAERAPRPATPPRAANLKFDVGPGSMAVSGTF